MGSSSAVLRWFGVVVLLARLCAAQTEGSLKLLTYNVAGLPAGLSSSDPVTNTPFISARLAPYDIINVQEDFNSHAALYASDNHPYRTATSGGVPFGSGLNTLSNYPFTDLTRVTWTACSLNSGDCLTPKGFTFARVQLAADVWLDVYNLHADAGGDAADYAARAANVAQVAAFLAAASAGMPVVLMGDTNMRYTTIGDSARALLAGVGAGAVDAWVDVWRDGTPPAQDGVALTCPFPFDDDVTAQADLEACEVVDKVFVRSAPVLALAVANFTNEHRSFLRPTDGAPLSDHYPQAAAVEWSARGARFRLSDVVGGPHGDFFSDVPALAGTAATPRIATLTIAGGERLDSVGAAYAAGGVASTAHGGTGGSAGSLLLADEEVVDTLVACQAEHDDHTQVFYLGVTTSNGQTLERGVMTDECTTLQPPVEGMGVVGFWGRAGDEVGRLGVVWG